MMNMNQHTYGIERGESVQAAVVTALTLYAEMAQEIIYQSGSIIIRAYYMFLCGPVGQQHKSCPMCYTYSRYRINGNE